MNDGRADAPSVLALMAHPDDAEILCGGTLALLSDAGWTVHIATATPGDCGSSEKEPQDIASLRRAEAVRGARRLGGVYHCLERRDLCVRYDDAMLCDAIGLLRVVRPRVVLTHSPSDYMLDHEQISLVARAATFGAPIPNAPAPRRTSAPLDAIPALYYADPIAGVDSFGRPVSPAIVVDVETSLERKLSALAEHATQREWLRAHHGVDEYLDSARRWAAERGKAAGVAYGEGFRQHRGHAYPSGDVLAAELAGLVHTCA